MEYGGGGGDEFIEVKEWTSVEVESLADIFACLEDACKATFLISSPCTRT